MSFRITPELLHNGEENIPIPDEMLHEIAARLPFTDVERAILKREIDYNESAFWLLLVKRKPDLSLAGMCWSARGRITANYTLDRRYSVHLLVARLDDALKQELLDMAARYNGVPKVQLEKQERLQRLMPKPRKKLTWYEKLIR